MDGAILACVWQRPNNSWTYVYRAREFNPVGRRDLRSGQSSWVATAQVIPRTRSPRQTRRVMHINSRCLFVLGGRCRTHSLPARRPTRVLLGGDLGRNIRLLPAQNRGSGRTELIAGKLPFAACRRLLARNQGRRREHSNFRPLTPEVPCG